MSNTCHLIQNAYATGKQGIYYFPSYRAYDVKFPHVNRHMIYLRSSSTHKGMMHMVLAFQRALLVTKLLNQFSYSPLSAVSHNNGAVSRQEINRQYTNNLLHSFQEAETTLVFLYKPVPPAPFRYLGEVRTVLRSNMINRREKTPLPSMRGQCESWWPFVIPLENRNLTICKKPPTTPFSHVRGQGTPSGLYLWSCCSFQDRHPPQAPHGLGQHFAYHCRTWFAWGSTAWSRSEGFARHPSWSLSHWPAGWEVWVSHNSFLGDGETHLHVSERILCCCFFQDFTSNCLSTF